jgi:hypothetical protein
MLDKRVGGPYNRKMMNADYDNSTHPLLPNPIIGLPIDTIMGLSEKARFLYDTIFDYCTYSSDPQYQKLHKFRQSISKLEGRDRDVLIDYFNNDPAIKWNGMSSPPWEYYKEPY